MRPDEMPPYVELILPTIQAVSDLGQSATASEITQRVVEALEPADEVLAVAYPSKPEKSIFLDRLAWARSYAKLTGALESPSRGVFLMTDLGRNLLALPPSEAVEQIRKLDREFRRERIRTNTADGRRAERDDEAEDALPTEDVDGTDPQSDWQDVLLRRLHRLDPTAFEEFVLYLLRLYGLELERVGGSGDEGIDGLGTAPLSDVLSSRVAVQVKRYDPNGRVVGRETVALFQRDAQTKGAERAILVTLGGFSAPARKAAISAAPTVDLIDGERLAELILKQELGVRLMPVVNEAWFDRFG